MVNRTRSGISNPVFLAPLLVCLLGVVRGRAAPIKPTVAQLRGEQQRPVVPYVPAHAGQNEPVTRSQAGAADLEGFNTEEVLRNAELARQRRAILMQVAIPDPRVLAAFALIILLLRKLRAVREAAGTAAPQPAKT